VDLVFGDNREPKAKDWLQESQNILKELKENLQAAQNQWNLSANRKIVERSFEVGNLLYLRLQPYRQSSLKKKGEEKLKPHFYGSYKIIIKVGEVAYELELPKESKIHNVFHAFPFRRRLANR
jgi:hypothetical protein